MEPLAKLLAKEPRAERERVIAAYNALCAGDPNSFPVQLALVTKTSVQVMTAVPKKIEKLLAEFAERGPMPSFTPDQLAEIGQAAGEKVKIPSLDRPAQAIQQAVERIEAITAGTADTRSAIAAIPKTLEKFRVQSLSVAFAAAIALAVLGISFAWWQSVASLSPGMKAFMAHGGGIRVQDDMIIVSGPFKYSQTPEGELLITRK